MFGGIFGGEGQHLPETWNEIKRLEDLDNIVEASGQKRQVIFKHSTRCSISSMAYRRMKEKWESMIGSADLHYLDLIQYRSISNEIAARFNVVHESPQILVIENGKCTKHASHGQVSVDAVKAA